MTRDTLLALIREAALAPSVHNVQPARWRMADDGLIMFEDLAVRLSVGDPDGNDAAISLGAAVEGLSLAASQSGLTVELDEGPVAGSDGNTSADHPATLRKRSCGRSIGRRRCEAPVLARHVRTCRCGRPRDTPGVAIGGLRGIRRRRTTRCPSQTGRRRELRLHARCSVSSRARFLDAAVAPARNAGLLMG